MSAVPDSDPTQAERFLTLLDESAESFCFRAFNDSTKTIQAIPENKQGSYAECLPWMIKKQGQGCGIYVVVNAGGQNNASIKRVRAVYVDTDGAPLDPIINCGLEPHIVIESSPGRYHVYWLVDGLPLEQFRGVQHALIQRFQTDKSINDLARVMRLPGMMHLKAEPFLTRIMTTSGALPYSAETILAHFALDASAPAPSAPASKAGIGPGTVVEVDRHADLLKYTLLAAASVHSGAFTRDEVLHTLRQRVANGRYTRDMPDEEIIRALDGALRRRDLTGHQEPQRASTLALLPLTPEDIQKAKEPQPNAFAGGWKGQVGLFPRGEVTVIGAPGREGKTSAMMAIAEAFCLGLPVARLLPASIESALIYSAEDDRQQYARKAGAHMAHMTAPDAERFRQNLLIPDLHGPELAPVREIVTMANRQATRGVAVEMLIAALADLQSSPCPPGLLIFETASTLSDAEEDNPGHKVMVAALKHIAKTTNTAVVLMHHTSQAAANNLPTLDISESDIRGGTTLVNNARQCFLLVNLGSSKDPLPEGDARTLLRLLVAPGCQERISALICLNTSKGMDPPPIFFRWDIDEDYGPRLVEIDAPDRLQGKSWKSVKALLSGVRQEAKADKKAAEGQANVRLVVSATAKLCEDQEQATARKVSIACGRNPGWAKPYLDAAVEQGALTRSTENVPRTNGFTDVYRPAGDVSTPWKSEETR